MRICITILCGVLLSCTVLKAQSVVSFNEGWKFHLGHAANPSLDFNYGVEVLFAKTTAKKNTATDLLFKDTSWENLNLPHDWAVSLPFVKSSNFDVAQHGYKPVGGLFPETSIGWYRKHFTVDKKDSGQRIQIQFDGIFRDANFWINGFYLGNHKSGYTGISYDITDFLNYNKDNVIAIRVDATQYEGWFYEGAGIYRNVWMKQLNPVHLAEDGNYLHAAFQGNQVSLINEMEIDNQGLTQPVTVQTILKDRSGRVVAKTKELEYLPKAFDKNTLTQTVILNAPHLWSLEDPYLYHVVTVIKKAGKMLDSVDKRFGFRTIEIKTNGVFLNGKYIKVLGTNNHQDHAGVGSAIPPGLQYYRVRLLKEMGCNAYRTSHHPPTPELLDACDSLGMLVLDETRLLNSGAEYMEQFRKMIRRDRSRTSVFLWSIGNEEGYVHTNVVGKRIAQSMIAVQQSMDPSRTCTYAADVANVFKGINEVIPVRGFNYREYGVADYHKDHPSQPILGTEMGSTVTTRGIYEKDTIRCYVPDKDEVAPWWASKAETWWKLAGPNDYWLGGFIWTGFDYRGEPTPYEWPNISSHFGVMDVCGFPKNIYYYYQSWWTDKDVLHLLPHWNWRGQEGKPIDVWVFSNADSVELFLNQQSLGIKTMPRNGHLQWQVPYQSGELKAIGFKKGRILQSLVSTTDAASSIQFSPSVKEVSADGVGIVVVNVSVQDSKGREVPDANHLIRFSIKGDAKIIGVGNGDPSSHEADQCEEGKWQRSLFNGKCQLIVQVGKQPGNVIVEATGEGLQENKIDILAKKSSDE